MPRRSIWAFVAVLAGVAAIVTVAFAIGLVTLANLSQITTAVIVASVTYFIVLLTSAKVAPVERTRVRAFIPRFIANAVSEPLLSPIGLSVTTKLAPEAFRAQMMALYFFSVGLGTSMSGVLAGYYDPAHEFAYFGILGAVAIAVGAIVFAVSAPISRLMKGVH